MRQIISFILVLNLSLLKAQNCLTDWLYYQDISINNSNPVVLNDYQVKLTINTASLISAGKMQPSGRDLRFTLAASCCNVIPHFIESGINTASTVVWVKVPVLMQGASVIEMFYGNSLAPNTSNASNVFDLWEDFNNVSTQVVSKCGSGTAAVGGGQVNYSWTNSAIWESSINFPLTNIYTAEINVTGASGNWPGLYWKKSTGHSYSMLMGSGQVRVAKTSSASAFPADCAGHNWASTPTGYSSPAGIWSLTWINTGDIQGSFPGVGLMTSTDSENARNTPLKVGVGGVAAAAGSMAIDWLRVRKWAQAEPSVTLSSEQNNPLIPIAISISNNGFCQGQTTTITASGASSYTWSSGLNSPVIVVSPNVTTGYSVTSSNNIGCQKTAVANVTVFPNPVLSLSGSTVACTGQPATLTAGGASSYTWSTGEAAATITANINSPVTFTVYGESVDGCGGSIVQTVSVSVTPTVAVNGIGSICTGNSITISASGASSYSWTNFSSSNSSVIVSPSVSTSYSVTGFSPDGVCFSTAVHHISVTTAYLSASSNSACVDGPAILLNGSPAGGIYSGANLSGNTFTPPSSSGVYAVAYMVTNTLVSCSSSATLSIYISECTGIKEIAYTNAEKIKVYPNPAGNYIVLEFNTEGERQIEIYDATGKMVMRVDSNSGKVTTDISLLTKGVYFIRVKEQSSVSTGRFVRQ